MDLYEEFFSIVKMLNKKKVRFALVGGLSLAFYDRPRFTRDIDLLVHGDDMTLVNSCLEVCGFKPSAPVWRMKQGKLDLYRFIKIKGEDEILVDILVPFQKRDLTLITNALCVQSKFGTVPVARKEDIIALKKRRGSKQDLADIEALENDKN